MDKTAAILLCLLIIGVVLLNVLDHKYRQEEKIRRSQMTPEQREEAEYEEWLDSQW